jgi:Domain of unknown function (DUF5664)
MTLEHDYPNKLRNEGRDVCGKSRADGLPIRDVMGQFINKQIPPLDVSTDFHNLCSEVKVTNVSGFPGFKPTNDLTESTKFDSGKVRSGLVLTNFSNALLAVSAVGTFGALKYAPNNWKGLPVERLEDALYRHLLAHNSGEIYDSESGLTHLAHIAWNTLAILELTLLEDKKKQDASEI